MFSKNVERWRLHAHEWARWASARFDVALDSSDLLALIARESVGDPALISHNGHFWGLGQIGEEAVSDYNKSKSGRELTVPRAWLKDASRGREQIRVMAWLVANGRDIVSTWSPPDAVTNAALWADLRYGWGAGNTRAAIEAYRAAHGGKAPTFDELEAVTPKNFDGDGDGKTDVRPFVHARAVAAMAAADRGEARATPPFPSLSPPPLDVLLAVVLLGLLAALVLALYWSRARIEAFA